MNIGILYPRSKVHPGLGFDFLDGLKTFFKQHDLTNTIRFSSESIGFGGIEKEVYEKAEKLLMIDGVDVLVAYVDQRVIGILQPLFYAANKLVIVVNPGANYPLNWIPQPNTINLTLQQAFMCWLGGALAAAQPGDKAAFASTYYDCGYLHTTAMVKSHARAGGAIRHNYINNQLYNDAFEINQLTDFLSSEKETNNLLCVFDSLPGSLLYDRLNKYEAAKDLDLFVSPMMLEQQALSNLGNGFDFSIKGYVSWLPSKETEESKSFCTYYQQQTKRTASIFSLLGWETAAVLQQVLSIANDDYTDGVSIAEQLKLTPINSPRGELKLDPSTNYYLTPAGKCSIANNSSEIKIEWIDDTAKDWEAFVAEPTEGLVSGWMNTYLCY